MRWNRLFVTLNQLEWLEPNSNFYLVRLADPLLDGIYSALEFAVLLFEITSQLIETFKVRMNYVKATMHVRSKRVDLLIRPVEAMIHIHSEGFDLLIRPVEAMIHIHSDRL